VAVSTTVPPPIMARLDPRVVAAVHETAQVLRGLGHTVVERDPDYDAAATARGTARYFRGILDDAMRTEHPERLERRSKAMARIGRLVPGSVLARSLAETSALTERLGRLWDDVDVLLTPSLTSLPLAVGAYEGRGALWTFIGAGRFVPHLGLWNMTGQPAASVPAGFTAEDVPLAVHLVARSGDEATLLSLSAQIEAERPWADRRPAMAS
jgi:amidase